MVKEEDILRQATYVLSFLGAIVVLQVRVYVTYKACDFRPHAVLHSKDGVRQFVVDESLKEREVQLVFAAEFVHSRGRSELLVVADQDQVLAILVQGGHHVGFQHLQTKLRQQSFPANKMFAGASDRC